MANFEGTYEMISSERYDDFLKAVGVNMIKRTMASKVQPTMTWVNENGRWTQRTKTPLKSFQIVFTPGEEFEEELADGRKCQATITFEGNKLIHKQKIGDLTADVIRVFNGNDMVSTFTSGDVVSTRVFRRVG